MKKELMKSWVTWKEQISRGREGQLITNRRAFTGILMFRAARSWDKHGFFKHNSLEFNCVEIKSKGSPSQGTSALEDLLQSHSGKDSFWINLLRGYLDEQYQLWHINGELDHGDKKYIEKICLDKA